MPVPRKPPPPPPPPLSTEIPANGAEVFPEDEKRARSAKFKKLEEAVSGVYMMAGGALSTLPPQMAGPRVAMIGVSLAGHRDEIADAWVDLAEDDKRVLRMLESLTSFSGWGKVIGVHLLVVGASVPGIAAVMPSGPQRSQQQGPGMPQNGGPEDLQMAMVMAEMFRQAQSQQRAPEQPNFEQAPPPPPFPEQQPQVRRTQPPPTTGRPRAGMPSAADMGVSIPDAPADFPTAGPENVRG